MTLRATLFAKSISQNKETKYAKINKKILKISYLNTKIPKKFVTINPI